ncbi:maleylpyruvate isomerase family mycothiol-dependent enzyme [Streptacidiphilus fuscans]|uniref:Maleylpyruvate isomerase family mycothiol-dependent enzyme n=1 Tax=Streptacidiphilus fuscans TaxID=2789292 RepID=A0A931FFP6_9ACTN|nr:maleylpyruvate isomerase family mycothiol-dependent enzyme [Streptacidiphilus fuscans]MBF9073082.1 maleylpyruvate isomerase family mycothiol-dependent enzyme [Streptacidiphilus fuscans]
MAMDWLSHERYLDAAESNGRRLAEIVTRVGPDGLTAPVPSCPDWTLRDLVFHQGMVYRWIGEIVGRKAQERLRMSEVPDRTMEDDAAAQWLLAATEIGVGRLRDAGPGVDVWGWAGNGSTRWWGRRIAHETLVHGIDGQLTVGELPDAEPDLAADNIDELLANATTPAVLAAKGQALAGTGDSLHLHCTDVPGEWQLLRTADGFTVEYGHAKADAAVRGTAQDVMLWLNGRLPQGAPGPELFGEPRVHEFWRTGLALT